MGHSSLSILPQYQAPSSWWEHVPIAHWLVARLQPKVIVELGTHYGVSFFSFCEAALQYSPETFVHAVDTWEGDKHAGIYDETVYSKVVSHQQKNHKQRSRIIRSTFEDASNHFSDSTIDLIHIDGLHTYEAVSDDYKTWAPKLREGGSLMFHDWNVREEDFGVWRLWQEIKDNSSYQCLEIPNGHGLGIATYSAQVPEWHQDLKSLLPVLTCKGALLDQLSTRQTDQEILKSQNVELRQHSQNLELQTETQQKYIANLEGQLRELGTALAHTQSGFKARLLNRIGRLSNIGRLKH